MQQKLYQEYEYQISKSIGFMTFAIFGLFCLYGFPKAMNNDKGLTIKHTFELSTEMATFFWWASSLMFLLLALMGLMMVIKAFQGASIITLDDYQLIAPKRPFHSKMTKVKYPEIQKLEVHNVMNIRQLQLKTPYGQMVIPDANFVNKSDFDEMLQILKYNISQR